MAIHPVADSCGGIYNTIVPEPQIVIDTNVLVAGLRSRRGHAFRLLQLVSTGRFTIHLSVPLVMEYESVLRRERPALSVPWSVIEAVLDYHCAVAHRHAIFFLWRPFLRDPKDDMVLELAVHAACDYIVTYNKRDFAGAEAAFNLKIVTPGEFLHVIGA
ncbi:MAG: PIN domain-containing protein [Candidatus Tectimicrobiota bacterium]|nr:MAG: PIN domain-containing protein [Candidatus Tectomicrobia bacterium]